MRCRLWWGGNDGGERGGGDGEEGGKMIVEVVAVRCRDCGGDGGKVVMEVLKKKIVIEMVGWYCKWIIICKIFYRI